MKFFIENTRFVILISLLIIFMGIKGLQNLQKESIPPVDFATALITTVYPGSSAQAVEELITKKIEDEIRTVPYLKDVHSSSQAGMSQITIRIDMDNADTKEVINELNRALQNVSGLPPEVLDPPRLVHIDATIRRPVATIKVVGTNENRDKDKLAWELKNKIESLEGVLDASLSYYKKREILISLSTEKMDRWYISSNDVMRALRSQSSDFPAGYLESDKTRNLTRMIGNFRSVKELENRVVRSNFSGQSIKIKDIATVKDHFEKETSQGYIYSSKLGESFSLQPSVGLSVLKNLNSDLIDVVENIKKRIQLSDKENKKAKQSLKGNNLKSAKLKDSVSETQQASSSKLKDSVSETQQASSSKLKDSVSETQQASSSKLKDSVSETQQASSSSKSEPKVFLSFDGADDTKRKLKNVINNTLFGLILIFIIFFMFLPSRVGFLASFSLPLSVLTVLALMPFFGVSFNIITMLAFVICIGMLVDNSVVISEYYVRLTSDKKLSSSQSAQQVVSQFFKPITATVLTTVVVFLPMLITKGVMGEFIQWIPIVVSLALLISLFESFCLLPNRLQWLPIQKKPSFYQKSILEQFYKLEKVFSISLKYCLNRKYISLGVILFLFVSTVFLFKTRSKIDLFSSRNPELYSASITFKPNLPFELTDQQSLKIAEKVQAVFKGKENIDVMEVNSNIKTSQILIRVKRSVLKKLKYKEILQELRKIEKTEFIKELDFSIIVRGPPVGKALNVAFMSNDRQEILEFIDHIFPDISKIKGLLNLTENPDKEGEGTEYKIKVKEDVLAQLGLDFNSVGFALRTALEGSLLKEITEKNESFYIRVKHDEEEMNSLFAIKKIKVKELKEFIGRHISLGDVIDIKEQVAEPNRRTYNFSPVIFLQAGVDQNKSTSLIINNQAKKIIDREIGKFPNVNYKMIGERETTSESLRSLFQASVVAFFAVLVILVILFKSFVLSFLVLSCVPLGLIGVVWAFFLHGRSLSFFALIGVIGLAGVVVNSAIILISFILKLRQEKPEQQLKDIVVSASTIRLRPILITNLTTLGGLLPTAYGFPSFEPLLMPMTLALFWGLLSASLLTLFWVPCLYLIIEDIKSFFARLITRRPPIN